MFLSLDTRGCCRTPTSPGYVRSLECHQSFNIQYDSLHHSSNRYCSGFFCLLYVAFNIMQQVKLVDKLTLACKNVCACLCSEFQVDSTAVTLFYQRLWWEIRQFVNHVQTQTAFCASPSPRDCSLPLMWDKHTPVQRRLCLDHSMNRTKHHRPLCRPIDFHSYILKKQTP